VQNLSSSAKQSIVELRLDQPSGDGVVVTVRLLLAKAGAMTGQDADGDRDACLAMGFAPRLVLSGGLWAAHATV